MRDTIDLLRDTDFFHGLDEPTLAQLAEVCYPMVIRRGEVLFEEGDEAHSFYVSVYGRLGIWSGRRRVGEVAAGESVGEMALLHEAPRTISVRAERDCLLLRLEKDAFQQVLTQNPKAMLKLVLDVTGRLAGIHRRRPRESRSIAILALTDDPAIEQFCEQLHKCLEQFKPTTWYPPQDPVPEVEWFDRQEKSTSLAMYQCLSTPSEWSQRCVRQADRVILVGMANQPQPPSELERYWNSVNKQSTTMLALLGNGKPKNTTRWLSGREMVQVHHLKVGEPPRRVARYLNRKALALILGGGGARGLAHVGVLRALEERNVEVDLYGGTSMGGFVAALAASGRNARQVEADLRWAWLEAGSFLDPTFPLYSLVKGQKMMDRIQRLFGNAHIEDLKTPFFCMSSDITKAIPLVHAKGLVSHWVSVGMAIPGLAPPFPYRGRLLFDGGLLNNLPVDIAAKMECGEIMAINVDPREEMAVDARDFEGSLPQQLLRQFKGTTAPHILEIMLRITTLTNAASVGRLKDTIDHYIQPDTGRFNLFEFRRIDEIIQTGYDAMMAYEF